MQELIEIKDKRASTETLYKKWLIQNLGGAEALDEHAQGKNFVKIFAINNLTDNDWRKPIVNYLENPDGTTCRKIKYRALSYVIVGNEFFKKTPEVVLLKCLDETGAYLVVSNTHSGACGSHQACHKMKCLLNTVKIKLTL